MFIGQSKEQLLKLEEPELKTKVSKDSWVSLKQYFDGKGNVAEARIACVIIGTLAREEQSKNNARSMDILERRLKIHDKQKKLKA